MYVPAFGEVQRPCSFHLWREMRNRRSNFAQSLYRTPHESLQLCTANVLSYAQFCNRELAILLLMDVLVRKVLPKPYSDAFFLISETGETASSTKLPQPEQLTSSWTRSVSRTLSIRVINFDYRNPRRQSGAHIEDLSLSI